VLLTTPDELLHHYNTATCFSISNSAASLHLWSVVVPQCAVQHSFVANILRACAALHLAYLNPDRLNSYFIIASSQQDVALPLYRQALSNIHESNSVATYTFCHLLAICLFGGARVDAHEGQKAEQDELTSWLYFMHTGCLIQPVILRQFKDGPTNILAKAWTARQVRQFIAFFPTRHRSWVIRQHCITLCDTINLCNPTSTIYNVCILPNNQF
jgi:hypothetical protein